MTTDELLRINPLPSMRMWYQRNVKWPIAALMDKTYLCPECRDHPEDDDEKCWICGGAGRIPWQQVQEYDSVRAEKIIAHALAARR